MDYYVNDVRANDSGSLGPVPRILDFTGLQAALGPQPDHSLGWDKASDGDLVFKLVGFEVRDGIAAFMPQTQNLDGSPLGNILMFEHWDDGADIKTSDPCPRYEVANAAGFNDANGVIAFAYSDPPNGGPNGGPFTIWPSASPPGMEPQFCDACRKLGWVDHHVNCNPIFRLVRKGVAPPIPGDPTDPSDPIDWVPGDTVITVPPDDLVGLFVVFGANLALANGDLSEAGYLELIGSVMDTDLDVQDVRRKAHRQRPSSLSYASNRMLPDR